MILSCIAAMSENRVIGVNGKLPWRLPSDLAWFKRTTMGHPILMGRRTWESVGSRPLPGRTSVVVTSRRDYAVPPGALTATSLEDALSQAAEAPGAEEVFVVGGGLLYRDAVPRADRLYLTTVHANVDGDTRFPPLDEPAWKLIFEERRSADERNAYDHTFRVYDRVSR
ncbi:MAG TPA: dihydrofolate reductase [bacterium]|nr:dihydrofolate reductase [bacterium]